MSESLAGELARRAADHWRRVKAVMRAVDSPSWPGRGVEVGFTRNVRPRFNVGDRGYALVADEPADGVDRVLEIGPGRSRLLAATGVIDEGPLFFPSLN